MRAARASAPGGPAPAVSVWEETRRATGSPEERPHDVAAFEDLTRRATFGPPDRVGGRASAGCSPAAGYRIAVALTVLGS